MIITGGGGVVLVVEFFLKPVDEFVSLFKCLRFCRDTEISYLILKYIFLSLLLEIILVIECYDFRYLPDALVFQRWKGRLHVVHHLLQIRPCTFQSRCQQQEQQRPRHTS